MTQIIDSNRFGKLTKESLISFIEKYSLKLPNGYCEFLLEHNGGDPEPNICENPDTDVQWIYGIHEGEDWASLEYTLEVFKDRIPNKTIPIANDSLGNLFLLSMREDSFGEIWFWDHELESEGKEYFDNIIFNTKSFNEFIENLYEWVDENETNEERIVRENDLKALRELINSGYDLDIKDKYNRSLIENACIYNRLEMVKLLFEKGAELFDSLKYSEQNHIGSPTRGYDRIIEFLINTNK